MFQKYIAHSFPPTLFYLVSFGYNFQPALLRAAWYLGLALLKSSDGCWFGAEPYWEDSISGTQSDVAILSALFHIWSYIGIKLTEYSLVTYHFLIFVHIHIDVYIPTKLIDLFLPRFGNLFSLSRVIKLSASEHFD